MQSNLDMNLALFTLAQTQPAGEQLVPAGDSAPAATNAATTGTAQPATTTGTQQGQGGLGLMFYIPVVLLVVFMLWSSSRAQKKEQQRRQELMKGLHRGDKVQTIGGVIGTISDISDDEVVLTIEQGRVRVAKSAVQQVLRAANAKAEAVLESKPEAGKTANA